MTFVLVIIIAISVFGAASYYTGLRTYQYLAEFIPFMNNKVYWVLFWLIATSFIFGRINIKVIPQFVKNAFNLVGSYWLTVMMYSIILFVIIDLALLLIGFTRFKEAQVFKLQHFNLYIGISLLVIITAVLIYGTYNARDVKVKAYDIKISKKTGSVQKLHVVMFSDTHLGAINNNSKLEAIVEKVNSLKPDIVLLGGDLIDDSIQPYIEQGMAGTFKKLNAKYGVYGILGNHDGLGGKVQDVVQGFEAGGIKVLRDQYVKVDKSFYIVGREYGTMGRAGTKRKPLAEVLVGVDKSLPVILLDHNPSKLTEAQEQHIDLQLSGHTHAGQLFPANLITKKIYEMDWGYLKKGGLQLIVSSGAATWGPPVRLGSNSEILEINIIFGG